MEPIAFDEVHHAFGRRHVLRGASLRVAAGSTTVLLGANGQGKSTLLRLALGVLRPMQGRVTVLGCDPVHRSAALRARIGYVPDRPDVHRWMTVADLFRHLAAHYRRWSREAEREWIDRLALPLHTPFRAMSRGEGMKAMLAAALIPDPEVLLLDEPFAGLDPLVREELLRLTIEAVGMPRRAVLCATHDLDVALRIADRVALLAGGRIVREGPCEDFAANDEAAATPADLHSALAAFAAKEALSCAL